VEGLYGERLVTLAVFGSVGRGAGGPDSDIDLLIVARRLPWGRIARMTEFRRVEDQLAEAPDPEVAGLAQRLSPVIKTPEETRAGSPLFLDMLEDACLLVDREGFFEERLRRLRRRLEELGARRIQQGDRWYWDLKPDYRPGEVFEL
jgi:uncharacterized protein